MLNQINSKKQGDVGMGVAIGYFAAQGWTVCIPLTDSQDYDLIVDDGSGLKKVQVKTVKRQRSNGSFEVELRTISGYKPGMRQYKYIDWNNIDYLFILTASGAKYFIPAFEFCKEQGRLTLGTKMNTYLV